MAHKTIKQLIVELVLLAVFVGLIPELFVAGLGDLYGACGFSADICRQVEIGGAIKLLAGFICILCALVIVFLVSKELNGGDGGNT